MKIADAANKLANIVNKTLIEQTCRSIKIIMVNMSRTLMKHHQEIYGEHSIYKNLHELSYAAQMVIDMEKMIENF